MTGKSAVVAVAAGVAIGVLLGLILVPLVRDAAFALVSAGEATGIDDEWRDLNEEMDRGGLP